MVRAAAKNHPTSPWSRRRRRTRRSLGALGAGGFTLAAAPRAGRPGVRRHRRVRRRGGRSGARSELAPPDDRLAASSPGCAGCARATRAALRREPAPAAPRSTPTRPRRPGWPRPSSCTARRCRTTTTSTPTRPGGPRTTSTEPAVAIIKHANPCGIAVGADVGRGAPQGARLRPGVGVRRRDRGQPAGHRRSWPSRSPRSSPRSWWRRPSSDGAVEILRGKKNIRAAASRRPWTAGAGGVAAGLRRPAGADGRPARRGRRRPGDLDAGHRRRPPPSDAGATWPSPGGPCRAVKSNAILLASGRRHRRRRHGPGQPGRLGAARGRPGGRRAGGGLGRRVRRVLPVRGRPAVLAEAASGRSCSRAARSATRRSSPRPKPPASPCTSPAPGTSSTDGRCRNGCAERTVRRRGLGTRRIVHSRVRSLRVARRRLAEACRRVRRSRLRVRGTSGSTPRCSSRCAILQSVLQRCVVLRRDARPTAS